MKKVFYLYQHGTLQQKDHSLCLILKNGNVEYLPIHQIDLIICFSEINLNKRVFSLLNKYQISLFFFNYYGNYIGRFTPREYKNGKVLVKQVETYQNKERRLYVAKAIILGSIKNMAAVTKYYHKKDKPLEKQILILNDCMSDADNSLSIDELLLHEAKAKQVYYSIFDIILEKEEFKFIKRSKNPPMNEINALMSYGYAILYSLILAILDRSSLQPQISFIHSLEKNYDSLQFDLADVFKPIFVDRLILRLIRKKQLKIEYFEYKEDGRCFLNKYGIEVFVNEFDRNLKTTVNYNGKSYSYRSLLSKEVHKLSNYIKSENNKYKAFVMKW